MPPADDDHATVAQAPAAPTPTASAPAQQAKVEPSAAAGSPAPAAPAAPVAPKAATNEQPAPAANEAEAKVEPAAPNTATVQPAAQQAPNSCNVQACGARYSSFRAADCTYQPYGGDRRLCTIGTSTGATASAMPLSRTAKPRQAVRQPGDRDELGDVERIVRHQPLPLDRADYSDRAVRSGREMTESERIVRRMTRDSETDIPVQGPDGQIIIVRKTYR